MTNSLNEVQTSLKSDEISLLPCPFCGGEARTAVKDYGDTHYWRVYCDTPSCAMCMTGVFHSEAEAIAAWNTRAERTCKPVEKKGISYCSECDYPLGIMSVDAFCGGCGAKVVSE